MSPQDWGSAIRKMSDASALEQGRIASAICAPGLRSGRLHKCICRRCGRRPNLNNLAAGRINMDRRNTNAVWLVESLGRAVASSDREFPVSCTHLVQPRRGSRRTGAGGLDDRRPPPQARFQSERNKGLRVRHDPDDPLKVSPPSPRAVPPERGRTSNSPVNQPDIGVAAPFFAENA